MSKKIFGHDWADIQRAQQGGQLHRPVVRRNEPETLLPGDVDLLEKHGAAGLHSLQFFGVIDRLRRAGLLGQPN